MSRIGDYIMMQPGAPNYGEVTRSARREGNRLRASEALARGDLATASEASGAAGDSDEVRVNQLRQDQLDIGAQEEADQSAYAGSRGRFDIQGEIDQAAGRRATTARTEQTASREQQLEAERIMSDAAISMENGMTRDQIARMYPDIDEESLTALETPGVRRALVDRRPEYEREAQELLNENRRLGNQEQGIRNENLPEDLATARATSAANARSTAANARINELRFERELTADQDFLAAISGAPAPSAPASSAPAPGVPVVDATTGASRPQVPDADSFLEPEAPTSYRTPGTGGTERNKPGGSTKMRQDRERQAAEQPAPPADVSEQRQAVQSGRGQYTGYLTFRPDMQRFMSGPWREETFPGPDGQIYTTRVGYLESPSGSQYAVEFPYPEGEALSSSTALSTQQQISVANSYGRSFRDMAGGSLDVLNDPKVNQVLAMSPEAIAETGANSGLLRYALARTMNGGGVLSRQDVTMTDGGTVWNRVSSWLNEAGGGGQISATQAREGMAILRAMHEAEQANVTSSSANMIEQGRISGINDSLLGLVTPGHVQRPASARQNAPERPSAEGYAPEFQAEYGISAEQWASQTPEWRATFLGD
jgi:hypothetical protein